MIKCLLNVLAVTCIYKILKLSYDHNFGSILRTLTPFASAHTYILCITGWPEKLGFFLRIVPYNKEDYFAVYD